jgi:putative membrane protein
MENVMIREGTFNPAVRTYIFLVVLFFLIISIIGWLVIPFWLCGLGQWLSKKFYHTLKCQLNSKTLKFSKGLILRVEKTIPLENIQDLSFVGGPILRAFGLTMIKVETAGGGGAHHSNAMSMIGLDDSEAFKNLILDQREKAIREKNQVAHGGGARQVNASNDKLLLEIKNELVEIKNVLKQKD